MRFGSGVGFGKLNEGLKKDIGVAHPDAVSTIIMEAAWEDIRREQTTNPNDKI